MLGDARWRSPGRGAGKTRRSPLAVSTLASAVALLGALLPTLALGAPARPLPQDVVQATELAPGHDRYPISGLGGPNDGAAPPERGHIVSPNDGRLLPLGPDAPRPDLGVSAFTLANPFFHPVGEDRRLTIVAHLLTE